MTDVNRANGLKICLVGPAYPYRGGISHYNMRLSIELGLRHDVRLVNFTRLYPDFLFPGKTQLDESESALRAPSVRLIDSLNPLTWIHAGFHIARLRPDLTIFQWWHPYFAPAYSKIGGILRVLRRGVVLFICHNVVPHETSPIDRVLTLLALQFAHGYIVQSGEDLENLLRIRKEAHVEKIPMPLFDFFGSGRMTRSEARRAIGAGEGPLLLFFGLVRSYKGLSYLIDAMPAIRERTGARLLVVGEFYEDRQGYEAQVEDLGLSDAVRFEDRYIENEEVGAFFTASDLVVLPYLSATQSAIAQIAVAFERPVVVTRVGGLPEAVADGKTGFVVPPRDSGAIAAAVARFFEEGWAERMAPHFASERERFSWGRAARTVEELHDELSRGGRSDR